MSTRLSQMFGTGQATFVFDDDGQQCSDDPRLLGWYVDEFGQWTVALVIDGQLVFVRGKAQRDAPLVTPPGWP